MQLLVTNLQRFEFLFLPLLDLLNFGPEQWKGKIFYRGKGKCFLLLKAALLPLDHSARCFILLSSPLYSCRKCLFHSHLIHSSPFPALLFVIPGMCFFLHFLLSTHICSKSTLTPLLPNAPAPYPVSFLVKTCTWTDANSNQGKKQEPLLFSYAQLWGLSWIYPCFLSSVMKVVCHCLLLEYSINSVLKSGQQL